MQYNYLMPVREPGVIVYITGEQLPPPLPSTQFGYGTYVPARNGPYKPTFFTIRDVTEVYSDINPVLNSDFAFLLGNTSMFGMLLPALHIKKAVGFVCFKDVNDASTSDFISEIQNSPTDNQIKSEASYVFYFPSWLNGIPKNIGILRNLTVTFPVQSGYKFSPADFFESAVLSIGSSDARFFVVDDRYLNPNFTHTNLYNILSAYNNSSLTQHYNPNTGFGVETIRDKLTNFVVYRQNNSFLIWFRTDDSNGGNYVLFLRNVDSDTSGSNNNYIYDVFLYSDQPLSNELTLTLSLRTERNNVVYSDTVSFLINQSANNSVLKQISNSKFDILYITPSIASSSLDINMSYNPVSGYELSVTKGTLTINYNISYSPLDSGYYGFIKNKDIEMFVNGDIYTTLNTPSNNPRLMFFGEGSSGDGVKGIFSNFHFNDIRHINAMPIHLVDASIPSSPSYTYAGRVTTPSRVYKYVKGLIYDTDSELIEVYQHYKSYHQNLIYYEDDTVPFWDTPTNVDLLSDYSGKLNYSYTLFIRSAHSKLMFKICGTPDLIGIRLSARKDFVKNYWKLVIGDRVNYSYYRIQGNSIAGVSGAALYMKAITDYQYRAIFGINAPLSMSESDHEFPLTAREEFLDENVNSIVKDRVLSLFYINNNLTEEAMRDDSPLGEEQNARFAIRLAKVLALFVERYIGEPNNELTRNKIVSEMTNFINAFSSTNPSNMIDFRVICDESNNPPAVVANNELHIRVEVKFAKSIKYIVVFERVLMST